MSTLSFGAVASAQDEVPPALDESSVTVTDDPPPYVPYVDVPLESEDVPPGWTLEELLGEPVDLHPRIRDSRLLRGLGVGSIDEIEARFDQIWLDERALAELDVDLVIARARIDGAARRVELLSEARTVAIAERERTEERLAEFAVASFRGGEFDELDLRPDGEPSSRPVLTRDAGLVLTSEVATARDAEALATEDLSMSRRILAANERTAEEIDDRRVNLAAEIVQMRSEISGLRSRVGDELFRTALDPHGLTPRAVSAYLTAAEEAPNVAPGCRPTWWQLAGIGRIESRHGTFGGAELQLDGTPSIPIIGPRLDGVVFASIGDSDGGRLDGDTEWDRAVGPMQFIPTSWARYGADADGDGVADPQDLDDAALAAARHLCGSVPGMSTPEGYAVALFGYNHSLVYVADVQREAEIIRDAFDDLLS